MADNRRPSRLVWFLALFAIGMGTGAGAVLYLKRTWGASADGAPQPPAPGHFSAIGYVDVRGGVIPLFPSQPGRVAKIHTPEGGTVDRAGVELLSLDDSLANQRLAEADAALKAARAQVELAVQMEEQHALKARQQEAAIKIARQNLNGAREVYQYFEKNQGISSPVPWAEAKTRFANAQVSLDLENIRQEELQARSKDLRLSRQRAEAELKVMQARREQAQLALNECVLKSPSAGKVLRLQANVGEMLTPQVLHPPIIFCPTGTTEGDIIVRAEVDPENAGRVQAGDEAVIEDESGVPANTWKGGVESVSGWMAHRRSVALEPVPYGGMRTLECLIKLTDVDPNKPLPRIGQRVSVHIRPKSSPAPQPSPPSQGR